MIDMQHDPVSSGDSGTRPSDGPLSGRVGLVTGGSRGIGLACAMELGRLGMTVVISATRQETVDSGLAALRESGVRRADGHVADVCDQRSSIAGVTEGREVESGLGEEPVEEAGPVLHSPKPGLHRRGRDAWHDWIGFAWK